MIRLPHGTRELEYGEGSGICDITAHLSRRFALADIPRIFIINSLAPNAAAFSFPQMNGIGLVNNLDYREIKAVPAHEIDYIKNGDTQFLGSLILLAATPLLIRDGFLLMSRLREYATDV